MNALDELAEQVALFRWLPDPGGRRALRRKAGLSAADVARTLGVSEAAVLAWERGTRSPHGPHKLAYARLLKRIERLL